MDDAMTIDGQGVRRVYRMTVMRRTIHWINALSIFVAAVTGIYIADPFFSSTSIPYLMAWDRELHLTAAITMDISVFVIVYLYFFSQNARQIDDLAPTRSNLFRFQEAFLNFLFLNRRKRFDSSQPDPFNGLMFVILHILVVFQLITGLQLYVYGLESGISSVGAWWPALLHWGTDSTLNVFGGIAGVRAAHHTMMYPIIAWAILHIYYEVWRTVVWGEGDIGIAFGGYKFGRFESAARR